MKHNGYKYTGYFRDGKPEGQGREDFPDGASYKGMFMNGQANGRGVYVFADKDVY